MKSRLTFIFSLCVPLFLHAQSAVKYKAISKGDQVHRSHQTGQPKDGSRENSYYLETFDEGLGDWSAQTAMGIVDWTWTDMGPGTTGSTYPVPALNCTPGWAMIDDDHDGMLNLETEAWITSPVIDLSGAPADLKLEFDQYFQEWQNDYTYVGISTNGGFNWNEILINEGVGRDLRPNPERVMLNISQMVAADPSNVQIRFRYRSTWDYGWQLDNIGIFELPAHELIMNTSFISQSGDGVGYGRIPTAQIGSEMYVGAELFNAGSMPLTGIVLELEVLDPQNNVAFSEEFTLAQLNSWDTVLVGGMVSVPGPMPGIYTAMFTATSIENGSDVDLMNNVNTKRYEINESLYALDAIGLYPAEEEQLISIGTASFLDNSDDLLLMNYFAVKEQAITVHGIQFDLEPGAEAGSYVYLMILDSSEVMLDIVDQPIAQSQIHDLTQAEVDAGTVNIPFDDPVELPIGAYYAAVSLNSISNTADLAIVDELTVPQPPLAAVINTENDGLTYANGNAFAIRLILDAGIILVPELDQLAEVSIQPNPTTGLIQITAATTDLLELEILDATGRIILSDRIKGSLNLDLSDQEAGIYMLRISDGKAIRTLRMVKI